MLASSFDGRVSRIEQDREERTGETPFPSLPRRSGRHIQTIPCYVQVVKEGGGGGVWGEKMRRTLLFLTTIAHKINTEKIMLRYSN